MQSYYNVDQVLHQLCQILAKVNRTFVTTKSDDSHTNLFFDSLQSKILSRWISTEKGEFLCALNILDFQFEWINSHYKIEHIISIDGKTQNDIQNELNKVLTNAKVDTSHLKDEMHYDIPNYSFKADTYHSLSLNELSKWINFRALANNASSKILGTLQTQSEIRIWPHHFDTGIFTTTKNNIGIGFGLAMRDSLFNDAYFYFSVYKNNSPVKYNNLSELTFGNWFTSEHWNGAVLALSLLNNESNIEKESIVNQFINEAIEWTFKENIN